MADKVVTMPKGNCSIDLLNPNNDVMDSLDKQCNELKHAYDSCFNIWFADSFLKGNTNSSPCESMLKAYSNCVKEAMKSRNMDPSVYAQHWKNPPEAETTNCKQNKSG